MSKEKRAADLDAELAALEAELAALEAGTRKARDKPAKKAKKAKEPEAPEPAADAAPSAKRRLSLPFGRRKEAAVEPELEPVQAPAAPATTAPQEIPSEPVAPAAPAAPPGPQGHYDLTLWRQEGSSWVRTAPDAPKRAVRRILDEQGALVREEPAAGEEVERVDAVKAERGLGRLFRRKGA